MDGVNANAYRVGHGFLVPCCLISIVGSLDAVGGSPGASMKPISTCQSFAAIAWSHGGTRQLSGAESWPALEAGLHWGNPMGRLTFCTCAQS